MSQGPLCPNLTQKVQKEVSQIANRNLSSVILNLKISNYFCVSDKLCEPPKDSPQYDKLYKVRPVLEQMNTLFPRYYKGSSHQAIDESMVKTRSHDSMRNYCPMKPAKFGHAVIANSQIGLI